MDAPSPRPDPFVPLIVLLVIALALAFHFGLLDTLAARTLIRVRADGIAVERGQISARAAQHVADVLREAGLREGHIAITSANKVSFSRHIPPALHQRLRNILLN